MIEVFFKGQLTEDDYLAMNVLVERKTWKKVALFVALLAVLTFLEGPKRQAPDPLKALIAIIVVGIFALVTGPLHRRAVRRVWKSNMMLQQPVHGSVSEDGIQWDVHGIAQARFPWSVLHGYRDRSSFVLVYQGLNQVLYFFRTYFQTDADWATFKDLVAKRLPPK